MIKVTCQSRSRECSVTYCVVQRMLSDILRVHLALGGLRVVAHHELERLAGGSDSESP